jgi:hypothetical protein
MRNISAWHPTQFDQDFRLFAPVHRIWQELLAKFSHSDELDIWQTSDCRGKTWWHAHNPATGRSVTRGSAVEILEWIDQCSID